MLSLQNTALVYLNISHNRINSLEGLALAPTLRVLNVGHNRIVSLAALEGCTQLEELWVHNNKIMSLRQVEHLAVRRRVHGCAEGVIPSDVCHTLFR